LEGEIDSMRSGDGGNSRHQPRRPPHPVGSHYHFIETNAALKFDRGGAHTASADIPAGPQALEPGETKTVKLVEIAGKKIIRGGTTWRGKFPAAGKKRAETVKAASLRINHHETHRLPCWKPLDYVSHKTFALCDMFGPTTAQGPARRHLGA